MYNRRFLTLHKMWRDRLHVFPVFIVIYVPVSFFITYGIAVYNGNVKPDFPYISDTGTTPPESCVFGQLLNIAAVVAMFVFYIRYKQIDTFKLTCHRKAITRVNKVAFVIGLLAAFGISLVGNFQEDNVVIVHMIGAFLAFVFGGLYCCVQTYLSFKLPDIPGSSRNLRLGRLVICILDFAFMINIVVMFQFTVKSSGVKPTCWTAKEPGMSVCLASTISEWIISFLTCIYVATFTPEFKYFELIKPEIHFHEITRNSVVPGNEGSEAQSNGTVVTASITETSAKY